MERSQAFHHVGLLIASPPGTGRVALHLVIRKARGDIRLPDVLDPIVPHQEDKEHVAYFLRLLQFVEKPQEKRIEFRRDTGFGFPMRYSPFKFEDD